MKRDLDLIRRMVLAIEDSPSGWAPELEFDGFTEAQVDYHAYLLVDAGLAVGQDVTAFESDGPQAAITHLTWEGHEFADAARDESRWKSAMGIAAKKGGSITLDVMKELLTSLMKSAIGLT